MPPPILIARIVFVVLIVLSMQANAQPTSSMQANAQPTSIKLFDATPTFSTGPQTSPDNATSFASTAITLNFAAGDTAVISSTPDGMGPIVIDNFLTINDQNACKGAQGQAFPESCFGPIIDSTLPTGQAAEGVLTPIPPIDVRALIPVGTTAVRFDLRDLGVIGGNSDLFLVTTAPVAAIQPPTVEHAFDRTMELVGGQLRPAVVSTFQKAFEEQVRIPIVDGLRKANADAETIAKVEQQLAKANAQHASMAANTLISLLDGQTLVTELHRNLGKLFQERGAPPVSIESFAPNIGTPRIQTNQSINDILKSGFDPELMGFQWKDISADVVFRQNVTPTPVFAETKVKGEVTGEKGEKGKTSDTAKGKVSLEIRGNPTPGATATLAITASGQVSRDGTSGSVGVSFEWKF